METFNIFVRFVHIGSVAALVGGTFYMAFVMRPSLKLLDEQLHESLMTLARKRFMRITHTAIMMLILSGAWNWYLNVDAYRHADKIIHMLLGIKVLLAAVIFIIIFASASRVIKSNPAKWAWINIALATIIMILAATIRHLRLEAMHL